MIEIRRILCPVDFSDQSRRALDHAIAIARLYGAAVAVLHVFSPAAMSAVGAAPVVFEPMVLAPVGREQLAADIEAFVAAESARRCPGHHGAAGGEYGRRNSRPGGGHECRPPRHRHAWTIGIRPASARFGHRASAAQGELPGHDRSERASRCRALGALPSTDGFSARWTSRTRRCRPGSTPSPWRRKPARLTLHVVEHELRKTAIVWSFP